MQLLELGDDVLKTVLVSPFLDVVSLVRLAGCSTAFRTALGETSFVRRLLTEHGFRMSASTQPKTGLDGVEQADEQADEVVEQANELDAEDDEDEDEIGPPPEFTLSPSAVHSLADFSILMSLRDDLKSNHIVFHLASLRMVDRSKDLLAKYAKLLKRHPRLRIRIDAHTGVGAPPHIAPQHSVQRCRVVAQELIRLGIPIERVHGCAWGMDVGRARRWPASQEFARCEVFLCMPHSAEGDAIAAPEDEEEGDAADTTQQYLPSRPWYYDGIEPRVASIAPGVLSGEEEDETGYAVLGDGGLGLPAGLLQLIIGQLGPGAVVVMDDEEDEDE